MNEDKDESKFVCLLLYYTRAWFRYDWKVAIKVTIIDRFHKK